MTAISRSLLRPFLFASISAIFPTFLFRKGWSVDKKMILGWSSPLSENGATQDSQSASSGRGQSTFGTKSPRLRQVRCTTQPARAESRARVAWQACMTPHVCTRSSYHFYSFSDHHHISARTTKLFVGSSIYDSPLWGTHWIWFALDRREYGLSPGPRLT